MKKFAITVELLSPTSLVSGQADVNVDTEVVHDEYGMPYFPAKRFRGLLYESAIEVVEMAESAGLDFIDRDIVEELFHHKADSTTILEVSNLYLPNYEQMREEWAYLQTKFKATINASDVLEAYTSIRYQTALNENGITVDGSLHNIRVCDAGIIFEGTLQLINGTEAHERALALAMQNLHSAGSKRNRGFGQIKCTMRNQKELVQKALGM